MKDKLKACPFCGGKDLETLFVTPDFEDDGSHVVCISCQATGPIESFGYGITGHADAHDAWTTRALK